VDFTEKIPAGVAVPTPSFPVVLRAATPTVPVNVGDILRTLLPVPVEVVVPVPPLATGRVPVA
jgi:hypothetical protein